MNTPHIYTDDELRRIAAMRDAFKNCREYLKPEHGICFALARGVINKVVCHKARFDAQALIARAIGPGYYLENWLNYRTGSAHARGSLTELRHLWLDKLIADCRAALDAQGCKL